MRMNRRNLISKVFLLIVLGAYTASCPQAQPPSIRIAAASDLQSVMPEIVQAFEEKTGAHVDVTYGSSGNFFSQIQNGAPFDLFFSADVEYPKNLAAAGTGDPASLYEYAVGRLVIWTPPDAPVNVTADTWSVLLNAAVQKVAIANPQHAPYGRAAVTAM